MGSCYSTDGKGSPSEERYQSLRQTASVERSYNQSRKYASQEVNHENISSVEPKW